MVTLSALAPLALGRQVDRLFNFFCSWVVKGLQLLGVRELSLEGVSDLCVAERKVVGTALRLLRDKVLFQASVLVDPPLALLPRYLPYPSRAPAYRKGRSHLDFVTSLKELGYTLTPQGVAEGLSFAFHRALGNLSANPSPLGEAAFSAP
jgi:lipoate-protein ligase A